jgi:hypothetical protein
MEQRDESVKSQCDVCCDGIFGLTLKKIIAPGGPIDEMGHPMDILWKGSGKGRGLSWADVS